MVKKICFLLVILPLIFSSYGVASTPEVLDTDTSPGRESGEGLSEVVIKGEAKDAVKVEKAPYETEIKLEDIVTHSIEETESLMEGGLDILKQEDLRQFTCLNSKQVIRPSLPPLPEPPLVTFHPRRTNLKIKRWKLTISDEKGSNIRTLQGKGSPPRAIEWDGRDERGKIIRVGTLYSYDFVAMDEDGRPHTTGGKPFQLWALKYDERDSVNIEIANRVLYTAQRDEFSEDGKLIMDKAIDLLRQYSRYPFRIEICTDRQDFSAWEKAKALLANYISGNMILLPEDLRVNVKRRDGRGLTTCFIIQTR